TPQPISRAARKLPSDFAIGLILTFVFCTAVVAQDSAPPPVPIAPPPNLAKLVAHRESQTVAERNEYTYRQTVTVQELDDHGGVRGEFKEIRDIIFSPTHVRSEQVIGKPSNT